MSLDLTKDKWPEWEELRGPVPGPWPQWRSKAEYDFARHRVEMFEELVASASELHAADLVWQEDSDSASAKRVYDAIEALGKVLARAKGDKTE